MQIEISQKIDLKTQAGAVIYFLQRMDIQMINDLLDDKYTYQEFKKNVFIQKLGDALDEFLSSGDTFLNCYTGFCNSEICNYKCAGFSFVANNTKNYIDLIIDIKDGVVQDMYECTIFKNLAFGIEKNQRIEIDKFEFPLFSPF